MWSPSSESSNDSRPRTVLVTEPRNIKYEILDNVNEAGGSALQNGAAHRPKTVDKGHPQVLLLGPLERRTSLKPKCASCYVCGKDFLLSSLNVHEKQCERKHEHSSKAEEKSSGKVVKKQEKEVCYLCGKEFFLHSIGVHETQCIKTWKAKQLPQVKEDKNKIAEDYSRTAGVHFKKPRTVVCSICGENVLKSSYGFHEKKCFHKFNKTGEQDGNRSGGTNRNKITVKPKTIVCYICGDEFLKASYPFHEKKCAKYEKVSTTGEDDGSVQHSGKSLMQRKGPRTKTCSICGLEILLSSFSIHEKQCQKKQSKQ